MNQPQPGDIGLTNFPGGIGQLIRLGQWLNKANTLDKWEHAYIVTGLTPDQQNVTAIAAFPGGARTTTYPIAGNLYSTGTLNPTDTQRQAILKTANDLLGTPYSFLDYLALATHRYRIPMPGLRHYINTSKHLICSQLCDLCYRTAGIQLFNDDRWPGYVTPADLAALITNTRFAV